MSTGDWAVVIVLVFAVTVVAVQCYLEERGKGRRQRKRTAPRRRP